jgi:hypothetical protein
MHKHKLEEKRREKIIEQKFGLTNEEKKARSEAYREARERAALRK